MDPQQYPPLLHILLL
jgi:hypothetical protein